MSNALKYRVNTFKKRFPKIMHNIITRTDITFIVNYLHVFKSFLMNLTRSNGSEKKTGYIFNLIYFICFSNKRLPLENEHTVTT